MAIHPSLEKQMAKFRNDLRARFINRHFLENNMTLPIICSTIFPPVPEIEDDKTKYFTNIKCKVHTINSNEEKRLYARLESLRREKASLINIVSPDKQTFYDGKSDSMKPMSLYEEIIGISYEEALIVVKWTNLKIAGVEEAIKKLWIVE